MVVAEDRNISSLGGQIIIMGELTYLLSHSPLHINYTVRDMMRFFMSPITLDQFRIYRTQDRPVGFVVWAYLSDEISRLYEGGHYELQKQDWRSGRQLWFVEFIAPFGHAQRMVDDMRQDSFADAHGRFIRRRNGDVRTIDIFGLRHAHARTPAGIVQSTDPELGA